MGILEQHRRGRLVVAGLIALALAGAASALWWRGRAVPAPAAAVSRGIPGERDRIVVEVLNPTRGVGLARAATRVLRDAGIDVVYFGSDTGAVADSTQLLVRRGSARTAARVARALGVGVVRPRPDPDRLVDVTVRLGRDFSSRVAAHDP
jgi:hypothetical protein